MHFKCSTKIRKYLTYLFHIIYLNACLPVDRSIGQSYVVQIKLQPDNNKVQLHHGLAGIFSSYFANKIFHNPRKKADEKLTHVFGTLII